MSSTPDLFIAFGPRALWSLAGIVTLVLGVWHVDRTWDEEGSRAYEKAKAITKDKSNVVIPAAELDAAFVFPWAFIIGWGLYALAYFFPLDGGGNIEVSTAGIVAAVASMALAVIASVPMGNAVKSRDHATKNKLGMMFVSTWLVLTVSSYLSTSQVATGVCCGLGMVSIVASMKILWKFRKMGDSWEQEGKPNPNPVVYNIGAPLFVWGWFLFWVGMAATTDIAENWQELKGLPIYLNVRTLLAFLSGCGMVPVVMFVDYAHDHGAEFTGTYGTDGRFFGKFLESPLPFLLAWTVFGASSLFNLEDGPGPRQYICLTNCILQGIVAGIFIQTALYKADMAGKNKWSMGFVLLFLSLAINIGLGGGLALLLSLPGAFFIILGQKTVFGDRLRGDFFMEHAGQTNPNPIVYSYGELFFMAGWISISLGMALPW